MDNDLSMTATGGTSDIYLPTVHVTDVPEPEVNHVSFGD